MHLFYIDDSRDADTGFCAFSALAVPVDQWKACFDAVRQYRRTLRHREGIYTRKEFHATDFVAGRGRIADRIVSKSTRCAIFIETLGAVAALPGVRSFNCVNAREAWAFERLVNRINRTMLAWNSHALLICDEGKDRAYTRLIRRMGVYNPIPSRLGVWQDTGEGTRNIPLDRVVEDPVFKRSSDSYFVQLADFCAFALLRKERPIPSRTRYGLDRAFEALGPIVVHETNPRDPLGIVR